MYFSPTFTWERFTRQQKTLLTASPFVYLNQKIDFRRELTFYTGYNTSTGSPTTYAIDQYRRSYRSWYTSADIVPINRSLYGKLSYDYKRPITEAFFSVSINASRYWQNTASDLRIVDGNYYTAIYKQNSKSDNLGASLYVSKGFYDWHLKTRLKADYNYSNFIFNYREKTLFYIVKGTDKDKTYERRKVVTGLSDGLNIEIKSGLRMNERVRGPKKVGKDE